MLPRKDLWTHPAQPQQQRDKTQSSPSTLCLPESWGPPWTVLSQPLWAAPPPLFRWRECSLAKGDVPHSGACCAVCHQWAACAAARVDMRIVPQRGFAPVLWRVNHSWVWQLKPFCTAVGRHSSLRWSRDTDFFFSLASVEAKAAVDTTNYLNISFISCCGCEMSRRESALWSTT